MMKTDLEAGLQCSKGEQVVLLKWRTWGFICLTLRYMDTLVVMSNIDFLLTIYRSKIFKKNRPYSE